MARNTKTKRKDTTASSADKSENGMTVNGRGGGGKASVGRSGGRGMTGLGRRSRVQPQETPGRVNASPLEEESEEEKEEEEEEEEEEEQEPPAPSTRAGGTDKTTATATRLVRREVESAEESGHQQGNRSVCSTEPTDSDENSMEGGEEAGQDNIRDRVVPYQVNTVGNDVLSKLIEEDAKIVSRWVKTEMFDTVKFIVEKEELAMNGQIYRWFLSSCHAKLIGFGAIKTQRERRDYVERLWKRVTCAKPNIVMDSLSSRRTSIYTSCVNQWIGKSVDRWLCAMVRGTRITTHHIFE